MKVVLSTSPHVKHASVLQRDFRPSSDVMYSFAPVGLLSLVASLRRADPDIDASLFDLNRQVAAGRIALDAGFYSIIADDLLQQDPDVIGFMTECDSYHHVLQICDALKARSPRCHIILGGPHASVVAEKTLARWRSVDAIVIGEGELSLVEHLESLSSGLEHAVPGVVRRLLDGRIIHGGPRQQIEELDGLPIAAYDLYPASSEEEIFIEAGRGCPFPCEFCSTAPYWQRKHRVKSPERLLEEIASLKAMFGTRRVHFTHDLFTANRKWVEAVCAAFTAAGAPVKWTCSARTDTVDRALLDRMAKAGCDAIYFGLESGSTRILKNIRKDIPLEQSFATLSDCRSVGIAANVGFIVGFPDEDEQSMQETFAAYEQALREGCRPVHIFGYCPFVGSTLHGKLTRLFCNGHFIDIPLGEELDRRNRAIIASDVDLFSSFYRAARLELSHGLDAVDEFSPLVEAVLQPTLALAELKGGLQAVFFDWVKWIVDHNRDRGAAAHRIAYGSPHDFARFIRARLEEVVAPMDRRLQLARFVEQNLAVAQQAASPGTISIANYRSIIQPKVEQYALTMTDRLASPSVLATQAFDFDMPSVMAGASLEDASREERFLVWQQVGDAIRLLSVDRVVFDLVTNNHPDGLMLGDYLLGRLAEDTADLASVLSSLSDAARAGVVDVRPHGH